MLVSVVVVTYNSAQFVLETLDSIAAQTYPELELIVTDDCSKDDTVEICRDWIAQHKERFSRTELLTVDKNTGIAGNCNRGYAAAHGEWIKGIAGDDILFPQCIEKGMRFAEETNCKIFTVALQEFGARTNTHLPPLRWINATAKEQFDIAMTRGFYLATPGLFCKKQLWVNCGKFDERFPLMEDVPFLMNVLLYGEKIYAVQEPMVRYRIHCTSVTGNGCYNKSAEAWFREVMIPLQIEKSHYLYAHHNRMILWKNHFNKNNKIIRKLAFVICLISDPLWLIGFIRQMIAKI